MGQVDKQQLQLQSAAANAVSGKTARACDSCLRRRARWYCASDDAFLCQSCDSSVHSANPLARRHDRVRLKTSSFLSPLTLPSHLNAALPAWHQRKARTPRQAKSSAVAKAPVLLVPDLEAIADDKDACEGEVEVDEEEQLLYQVPIFDPVLAEFCSPPVPFDETNLAAEETKPETKNNQLLHTDQNQGHEFLGFDPSDTELAKFAADVENLLGQGLDEDSFCIQGLGLLEARDEDDNDDKGQVKIELMDAIETSAGGDNFLVGTEITEFSRESLEFNFDSGSAGDEVEEQKVEVIEDCCGRTKVALRLDYKAVIDAWSCRGCSPWTDGERPQFNPDYCVPDFMGMWPTIGGVQGAYGEMGLRGRVGDGHGGREARVSRYREKRRTRLFSKKIRYEVRKLNAEKRPRMKGRFVKRPPFPPGATAAAAAAAAAGGSDGFPYV